MELETAFERHSTTADRPIVFDRVLRVSGDTAPQRFPHLHEAREIVFFERVRGRLITGTRVWELMDQSACIIPPMMVHDFDIEQGDASWTLIQYQAPAVELNTVEELLCARFDKATWLKITTLIGWLERAVDQRQIREAVANIQFLETITTHAPALEVRETGEHRSLHRLQPLLTSLQDTSRALPTLNEAAASCSISPSYFSRLFSKAMGMTFAQYVAELRLKRAVLDLIHTDDSLKQISHRNGFHQSAYFSACFKRAYGKSPSQFRAETVTRSSLS